MNLSAIVDEIEAVIAFLTGNSLIKTLFPQLAALATKVVPFVPIAKAVATTYAQVTAAGATHVQAAQSIATGLQTVATDASKIIIDADGNYQSVPANG